MSDEPLHPLYLIEGSDALARFRIARHRGTTEIMVSLHDGHGTLSFSASDAKALGRALIAVAEYGFEVAESPTAIRLREEASARRLAAQAAARQAQPATQPATPSLEDL